MGKNTKIGWSHHTFNPWWGCDKVSPACKHCYAEVLAKRYGHRLWGQYAPRRFFGDTYWAQLERWNREAEALGEKRSVFVGSQCDVAELLPADHPQYDEMRSARSNLFGCVERMKSLRFLFLTKRPENWKHVLPAHWLREGCPDNVWLGTTVENQACHDTRIAEHVAIKARVHFLSMEPLLEHVVLDERALAAIDWIILGGESGPRRRPLEIEWLRSVFDQARSAGIKVFMKQDAGPIPGMRGRIPDDLYVHEYPEAV